MKKISKLFISSLLILLFPLTKICATTFFSGYTGLKINYSGNESSLTYDPDLKLQAFFAGQFNFSENILAHAEFSIDTGDFISENIFHQTSSFFTIDEISLIIRGKLNGSNNYFSAFLGTYDPVGSDVFLQRYFGIQPIASNLTQSWLGLSGSILYPQRGFGLSDVIALNNTPLAFGAYLYLNHEDLKFFVFNADLRAAAAFRYLTFDFACGLGAPLADKYQGKDIILAIEKLYWHAGTTILLGNNYTQSLFLQAGIFNASFTTATTISMGKDDIYLLFEPRFKTEKVHFNLTAYSIPQATVDKMLFIDDTLGIDFNIYSDHMRIGTNTFTIGTHASVSFPNKTIFDIAEIANSMNPQNMNLNITGYASTNFLAGELHMMIKLKLSDFFNNKWYNSLGADIGFRTKL